MLTKPDSHLIRRSAEVWLPAFAWLDLSLVARRLGADSLLRQAEPSHIWPHCLARGVLLSVPAIPAVVLRHVRGGSDGDVEGKIGAGFSCIM
jgi:hypothetical protein